MLLHYESLKNEPKAFRTFTGLDEKEFQMLLQVVHPWKVVSEIMAVAGKPG